jgi:hypothetical protein
MQQLMKSPHSQRDLRKVARVIAPKFAKQARGMGQRSQENCFERHASRTPTFDAGADGWDIIAKQYFNEDTDLLI